METQNRLLQLLLPLIFVRYFPIWCQQVISMGDGCWCFGRPEAHGQLSLKNFLTMFLITFAKCWDCIEQEALKHKSLKALKAGVTLLSIILRFFYLKIWIRIISAKYTTQSKTFKDQEQIIYMNILMLQPRFNQAHSQIKGEESALYVLSSRER